ncbi:DNA-packaging protein [Oceanibium sediminis]|uniref:DNA-packaging protein n=1 Tax=Oceanibium sediminis TaxID=2026339 RepID=UPI001E54023B|nr:DNA-packaging protein [Oceanibium sediminis]
MTGRKPIVLSDAQVNEVETLAALLNQDQIADYLGISRNTFRAICARDADVAARYKRGKAKAIAHVANGLLQKARSGDTTSSIFYLKTQAGWRETAAIEHSGPDGGPVTVASPAAMLRRKIDAVAERMGAADRLAPVDGRAAIEDAEVVAEGGDGNDR